MAKRLDSDSEYRHERKFFTSDLSGHEMEHILRHHPAMFFEVYPERWVNNCYLDSMELDSYADNLAGVKDRVKARVRWYGALFGPIRRSFLELKIKKGLVGRKERFGLGDFALDEGFCRTAMAEVLRRSELPNRIRVDMLALSPVLVNRYRRKYFESADRKFRVTLDQELCYYTVRPTRNTFAERRADDQELVVELKYAPEDEEGAARISGWFPLMMSRNSKYATGVDRLYG